MAEVSIELDARSAENVYRLFERFKKECPNALQKAVNATARQAKGKLADKARETFTIKKGKFTKAIKQQNATASNLTATLKVTGAKMSLYDFQIRKNKGPTPAKAKVLNKSSLKTLRGNGKGMFVAMVKGSKGGTGHFIAIRAGKGRLPIHKRYSLSEPQMIGSEDHVYGLLAPDFEKTLMENAMKEIRKARGQ